MITGKTHRNTHIFLQISNRDSENCVKINLNGENLGFNIEGRVLCFVFLLFLRILNENRFRPSRYRRHTSKNETNAPLTIILISRFIVQLRKYYYYYSNRRMNELNGRKYAWPLPKSHTPGPKMKLIKSRFECIIEL